MEEIQRKDLEVLWTVDQVAKYFTISKRTVYQWISGGKMFDPAKLVYIGNLVRIPRSEVERIANKKKAVIVKTAPTPAQPATPLP
jgi:excisionase family DNA binding protein